MAKIVTSEGIQDFVATKQPTEVIKDDQTQARRAALAAKLAATDAPEIEPPKALAPAPGENSSETVKEPVKEPEPEAELDEDEKKFAKEIQKKIFKQIAKRKQAEAETKTAREEAAEAERFAEQLFNEREQYKRKAEELEKVVPRGTEPPKEPELVEPKPDDNKYYDAEGKFKVWEYSADLSSYSAKKALADDRKEQQAARDKAQKEARDRAEAAAAEEFKKRLEKAAEKHPDFMAVIESTPVILQNECLQYLARSVNGSELAYFLALPKNQERAEKIKGLSPYEGIAALRDLEIELGLTKLAAPSAAAAPKEAEPVRSAPAPITPINTNGAGTTQLDPAKMSFKELRAYERERGKRR